MQSSSAKEDWVMLQIPFNLQASWKEKFVTG